MQTVNNITWKNLNNIDQRTFEEIIMNWDNFEFSIWDKLVSNGLKLLGEMLPIHQSAIAPFMEDSQYMFEEIFAESEEDYNPELVECISTAYAVYNYIRVAGPAMVKLYEKFENWFKSSHLSRDYVCEPIENTMSDPDVHIWNYRIIDNASKQIAAYVDLFPNLIHLITISGCAYWSRMQPISQADTVLDSEDGIKKFVIHYDTFTADFEFMLKNLFKSYDSYVQSSLENFQRQPFPYPTYTAEDMIKTYEALKKMPFDPKKHPISTDNNIPLTTGFGNFLIRNYHKSIWHSNCKGHTSPYDAWYLKQDVLDCIKNRMIFKKKLSPDIILQGFNVSKIAPKVTVFSAGRAKQIILTYLNDFDTIFDPFSTFSGRMLATISAGKKYIGIDPSEIRVRESNEIIKFLTDSGQKVSAEITHKSILDVNSVESYPCLFTCPPHSDTESWPDVNLPSLTCDEWIDECLKRFNCKRYVFLVDKTDKYKDFVKKELVTKSHLYTSNEKIIVIDK